MYNGPIVAGSFTFLRRDTKVIAHRQIGKASTKRGPCGRQEGLLLGNWLSVTIRVAGCLPKCAPPTRVTLTSGLLQVGHVCHEETERRRFFSNGADFWPRLFGRPLFDTVATIDETSRERLILLFLNYDYSDYNDCNVLAVE